MSGGGADPHARARALGKAYVAAINGGPEPYAALFAPDAEVTVLGEPRSPADVLAIAPPGRSGYRGVRTTAPGFVVTIRVIATGGADDQAHEITIDPDGLIRTLRAG
jgi:hypothetical protein